MNNKAEALLISDADTGSEKVNKKTADFNLPYTCEL